MLFTRIGVGACVKDRGATVQLELRWRKKNENEQHPMVAFDCGVLTQENADTFPILTRRDDV